MNNAKNFPCEVLYRPQSTKYSEEIRMFQGCPTIAVTPGGRIYAGWYAGGLREPHMNNYNVLVYSDDMGTSWSAPLLVIPGSYEKNIQALDIQLYTDPDGILHICWVQNNTIPAPDIKTNAEPGQYVTFSDRSGWYVDGYIFDDHQHAEWEITCENPDDENPVFSEPRFIFHGFLRCKPTFLKNGDWLFFNYDQLNDRYASSLSSDKGKTYSTTYGAKKIPTDHDEQMAYQLEDGSIRMLARAKNGFLAESISVDGGHSWQDACRSDIVSADTRFFVSRLPSGRILLITNDHPEERCRMTIQLSEDDGKTWKYKKCIDERTDLSYPDADICNGRICLVYDHGRITHKEILFASFTEQDIIDDNHIDITVISKPPQYPEKNFVVETILKEKLIVIARNIPAHKLIPTAQALYDGGIRLMEVTYSNNGDESDMETAKAIRLLAETFEGKMLIGAGTVLTDEQVRLTKLAGGCFIISPNTAESVIRETYRCGMISIPGALTPTEAVFAADCHADFVKLFPAGTMGPDYIKAIKAPLSGIRFLAVGGIDETNLGEYLKAGACGIGAGSSVMNKALIEKDDFSAITALAQKYVSAIREAII